MAMSSPCRWCVDRAIGCHSNCERYSKFREICEELKKAKLDGKERNFENYANKHREV